MSSAPPLDNNRVVDEGLLLTYFLNADGTDSHTSTLPPTASNSYEGHAAYSTASVRFSADTTKTTTERVAVSSSATPAVYFYPSAKHAIDSSKDSTGMERQEITGIHEQMHHVHHSFPSFNSMASSLLKDMWPGHSFLVSDPAATYPLRSDVSPITPTAQIGNGQETLILPPPYTTASSVQPSQDVRTVVNQDISTWNDHNSFLYPLNSTSSTNYNIPSMESSIKSPNLASATNLPERVGNSAQQMFHRNGSSVAPKSFADSSGKLSLPNQSVDAISHITWLKQLNVNVHNLPGSTQVNHLGLAENRVADSSTKPNPTAPVKVPSLHYPSASSRPSDFPIHTPIEFVPTGPFLNALSNIQRDMYNGTDIPKAESEEKRARRLERNRESARQSRRRKKERLQKLSTRVQFLHGEIENERRKKIESMESDLRREKSKFVKTMLLQIQSSTTHHLEYDDSITASTKEMTESLETNGIPDLCTVMQNLGPNSHARRAVANFQYQTLRHLILSEYQHFIMWLLTKGDAFLTSAKEKHSKGEQGVSRLSSKQIGEALAMEQKKTSKSALNSSMLSCDAGDNDRFWPYFCNELSIGIDQEDKMIQTVNSLRDSGSLSLTLSHLRLALNLARSLENGLLYYSHTSFFRNESALLHILTPCQSALYLDWIERNKGRVYDLTDRIHSTHGGYEGSLLKWVGSDTSTDLSVMNELCEKLKISLMIPTAATVSKDPKTNQID